MRDLLKLLAAIASFAVMALVMAGIVFCAVFAVVVGLLFCGITAAHSATARRRLA